MEEHSLRQDANTIIRESIVKVLPDYGVQKILKQKHFAGGKIILISVGKAAWQMAKAARETLGERITKGLIITKYDHSKGAIPGCLIVEAGHPLPDENSVLGAEKALSMVNALSEEDTVLFLLSGGGSALFEKPLIPLRELEEITSHLLRSGAGIEEINIIRKRLSAVKGGRFARACMPARVCSIILSDVLGDAPDMIASGPTCVDSSTCGQALAIVEKYGLHLSEQVLAFIRTETPKTAENAENHITGSVRALCRAASESCTRLGYETRILTTALSCQAKEAGRLLARVAAENQNIQKSLAFIAGGETVVHVTGAGKGGRNQEIALAAAEGIAGFRDTAVFSVGSDGTDGPTDAAGGFVDGETAEKLTVQGIDIEAALQNNDSYHALSACGGLVVTGPTGTNVNDVAVVLIRR